MRMPFSLSLSVSPVLWLLAFSSIAWRRAKRALVSPYLADESVGVLGVARGVAAGLKLGGGEESRRRRRRRRGGQVSSCCCRRGGEPGGEPAPRGCPAAEEASRCVSQGHGSLSLVVSKARERLKREGKGRLPLQRKESTKNRSKSKAKIQGKKKLTISKEKIDL